MAINNWMKVANYQKLVLSHWATNLVRREMMVDVASHCEQDYGVSALICKY